MKRGAHFTIEEELPKKINEQAKAEERSSSFIVNKILEEHFAKRERRT